MRVLVVEDKAKEREKIISCLKELDKVTFSTADSLSAAKEKLGSDAFDLILLNLDLPNGEGMDLFRRVVCITSTPILILSATEDDEIAIEAAHEGAYGYVHKDTLTSKKLLRHMQYAHKQFTSKVDLLHENIDLRATTRSVVERMSSDSRLEAKMDNNFGKLFDKMDKQGQRIASVETAQKSFESAIFRIPERVSSLEAKVGEDSHCSQLEVITAMGTKVKLLLWLLSALVVAALSYTVSHINWSALFGTGG